MNLEPPERCPVCSTASLLVEIVATPLKRSEPREDNVIWLCPSCHYELDRGSLQGFEFESVLARLMKASGQFETDSVVQDAIVVGMDLLIQSCIAGDLFGVHLVALPVAV